MQKFLASKNFSLVCVILNSYFAAQAFYTSNWLTFMVFTGLAIFCFRSFTAKIGAEK